MRSGLALRHSAGSWFPEVPSLFANAAHALNPAQMSVAAKTTLSSPKSPEPLSLLIVAPAAALLWLNHRKPQKHNPSPSNRQSPVLKHGALLLCKLLPGDHALRLVLLCQLLFVVCARARRHLFLCNCSGGVFNMPGLLRCMLDWFVKMVRTDFKLPRCRRCQQQGK